MNHQPLAILKISRYFQTCQHFTSFNVYKIPWITDLGGQNFHKKKNAIKTGLLHIYGLLKHYVIKTNHILWLLLHLTYLFWKFHFNNPTARIQRFLFKAGHEKIWTDQHLPTEQGTTGSPTDAKCWALRKFKLTSTSQQNKILLDLQQLQSVGPWQNSNWQASPNRTKCYWISNNCRALGHDKDNCQALGHDKIWNDQHLPTEQSATESPTTAKRWAMIKFKLTSTSQQNKVLLDLQQLPSIGP